MVDNQSVHVVINNVVILISTSGCDVQRALCIWEIKLLLFGHRVFWLVCEKRRMRHGTARGKDSEKKLLSMHFIVKN